MFAPHVAEGPGAESHYGYGWTISEAPWGGREIGHDGGNGVFSADFRRFPEDGIVVIAASNHSTVKAWRAAGALARIAHGEDVSPLPPETPPVTLAPLGTTGRHAVVRAWIEAYNTTDPERMVAFRKEHAAADSGEITDEERARMLRRLHDDLGELEPEGILEEKGDVVAVRAKTQRPLVAILRFHFDPKGKLAGVGVEVGD